MIQRLKKAKTVYLATQIVDMRKSINGLAAIVQGSFALDLYEGSAFEQFIPHKDYSLY